MTSRKAAPPAGLGPRGRAEWRKVTAVYELDPGELPILRELCSTADLITALAAELASTGLMLTGSMGQPVLNPVVEELRLQRRLLADLTARLALPADTGQAITDPVRRAASLLRWKAAHNGQTA